MYKMVRSDLEGVSEITFLAYLAKNNSVKTKNNSAGVF